MDKKVEALVKEANRKVAIILKYIKFCPERVQAIKTIDSELGSKIIKMGRELNG